MGGLVYSNIDVFLPFEFKPLRDENLNQRFREANKLIKASQKAERNKEILERNLMVLSKQSLFAGSKTTHALVAIVFQFLAAVDYQPEQLGL